MKPKGTKKIATALTVTIIKFKAVITPPQTFKRRSTTTKPRLASYTVSGTMMGPNINKTIKGKKLLEVIKTFNSDNAEDFIEAIGKCFPQQVEKEQKINKHNKEAGYKEINIPKSKYQLIDFSEFGVKILLRVSDHNINSSNIVEDIEEAYSIVFKSKKSPNTFRASNDEIDVTEYVYFTENCTRNKYRRIAKNIYDLLKTSQWDENNVPADVVNSSQNLHGLSDDCLGSIRTEPAPRKTITCYKLMRLIGRRLYPLFIDRSEPVELGVWYDADAPAFDTLKALEADYYYLIDNDKVLDSRQSARSLKKDEIISATKLGRRWVYIESTKNRQRRYGECRAYYNIGINSAGQKEKYAMRPGWHAGSLPTMRQIGKGAQKNLRDDSFVWTECEISADVDYNAQAQRNPDKDLPTQMPTNGFYLKATNADKTASQADKMGWYVAGAIKINRIIGDSEARQIIDRYNARQKPENRVLYDYERESGRDFDPEKKESTFEGIFNFWHNGKRTQRHNSDKRNDSGRISENSSRKTQKERDFRDIRCFENGLSDEQMRDFEQSERDLLRAASERIIKIAKQNNLFISPKQFYKFGGCKSKCTGESVVYTDGDTYIKVKDPFAKIAIKRTYATDVIYEHIIHNLLFPNTRYTFVGISEDCGDVRIILSQAAIDSYDRPTSKQITRYLKKVLGLENEGRYTWGNDYYAITDVGADSDNVLLGEDGELYFIDPLIKLKKRAKEVINYLLANQTSLSGVKRTATQTANHSALLRKHNIDLKRFEPFVSTDDLYPALQGVYFDPQGYLVASNSHVLIAEPAQIPQELSGKTINPKSQNECEGRFPDWRKAIPRAAQKTSEVDAARILQLADIADRFEEVLGYEVFLRLFPERILFKHSYVRTVLDYARKYHNGQCRSYPNDSCRTHLLQAGDTQLLLCPMVPGAGNEYPDEIYTEPSSDGKITFHVCKQTNYRKWTSDSDYYQFVSDNLTIDELFCIALAHLRDYQLIDSHLRSLEWTRGGYHDLAYFNRRFNCWSNLVDVIRPLAKQPTAKEVDKRRAAYRKSVGPGYDSLTAAESAFLYVCNDANCALLAPYIEQKPITVPRYGLMKPRFDLKMFTDCVAKDDRYGHRFDCVYISPQNFVRATNGRIFVDIAVPTREVLTTPELQEKGLLVHPRSGIIEKGDYGNFDGIIASQWDNPVDANIGWDDISKALQAGGRKGLIRIDGGICLWGKDCAAALKMCSMFDSFRYAKFSVSKNNMLLVISAGLSRIIIAAALPADADCSIVDLTTTDRQRRLRLAQAKASAAAAVLALLKVRQNV